jgi:hypothetical protein
MKRFAVLALSILVLSAALASGADAQRRRRRSGGGGGETSDAEPATPDDPLQAAEEAFTEVDFERTLEHAGTALQAGGQTPEQLVRIYQLLGVSAAALGDPDGARDFFQRMLTVNPEAQLDDAVPPRLRAPYLEARGIVSARPDRLGVEVGLARSQASVRVALTDPFQMARTLRVHARLEGGAEYTSVESEAMAEVLAPVTGADTADRVEYWVEVLDQYGNQLVVAGSEFEPRVVGRISTGGGGGGTDPGPGRPITEDPVFWAIVGSIAGAAIIGGAIGIGFGVDAQSHLPVQTAVTFGVR